MLEENYAKEVLEIFDSLQTTTRKAGGSYFDYDSLKNMTGEQLILWMATYSGMRFVHQPKGIQK